MSDPQGLTGAMPVSRLCTAMHPTDSRRRDLISASNCTQTSKCPYMGVCNQPRCLGIMDTIRGYSADLRCTLHNALPCTLEVVA